MRCHGAGGRVGVGRALVAVAVAGTGLAVGEGDAEGGRDAVGVGRGAVALPVGTAVAVALGTPADGVTVVLRLRPSSPPHDCTTAMSARTAADLPYLALHARWSAAKDAAAFFQLFEQ